MPTSKLSTATREVLEELHPLTENELERLAKLGIIDRVPLSRGTIRFKGEWAVFDIRGGGNTVKDFPFHRFRCYFNHILTTALRARGWEPVTILRGVYLISIENGRWFDAGYYYHSKQHPQDITPFPDLLTALEAISEE